MSGVRKTWRFEMWWINKSLYNTSLPCTLSQDSMKLSASLKISIDVKHPSSSGNHEWKFCTNKVFVPINMGDAFLIRSSSDLNKTLSSLWNCVRSLMPMRSSLAFCFSRACTRNFVIRLPTLKAARKRRELSDSRGLAKSRPKLCVRQEVTREWKTLVFAY